MPIKNKSIRTIIITGQILLLSLIGFVLLRHSPHVKAAGTITVTSHADTATDDGVCTLREAITAANTDTASGATGGECAAGSGTDTINFAITGTADFTNGGQNGYTIQIGSLLPPVTEPVTIDGYSQPGAQANSAISPNPFNGNLLIELDGQGTANRLLEFFDNSGGSTLKGLSLYGSDEVALNLNAPNIQIKGNYIGPDATGLVDAGNCAGLSGSNAGGSGIHISSDAHIGGLNPEDRNIISGNSRNACGFSTAAYPDSGWVIQGNYVGLAADGTTAMPNSSTNGSGSLAINDAADVIVGGTTAAAKNVISGNVGGGIVASAADRILIQGNRMGTDYTGTSAVPNAGGINLDNSTSPVIGGSVAGAGNLISGNTGAGIQVDGNTNLTIQGNLIGTDATGTAAMGNGGTGITVDTNNGTLLIGGTTSAARNIIADNNGDGITLNGITGTTVQGNYIGVGSDLSAMGNVNSGIVANSGSTGIIGGPSANQANIIANSQTSSGVNITGTSKVAILTNSIYANSQFGIALDGSQLSNDANDVDSGANNLLNYPASLQYKVSGADTTMYYSLDVPAGSYRVQFFSNTTADGSGNGEGETYLGYQTVTSTGSGSQSFTTTLTGNTHTNISATATYVDGVQPSGYGFTSSFSATATERPPVSDVSLTKTLLNPQDVAPGATIHYQFDYTNDGPDGLDLTQFATIFDSPPILTDYAPPELNATGYLAEGPLPGTSFIDAGNPDLTCLSGGPGSAGTLLGLSVNSDYSVVICWYTGADSTLPAGQSITANIGFTIANDSDLTFTNYALAAADSSDPDADAIAAINGGAGDALDGFIANSQSNAPINNFVVNAYTPPSVPTIDVPPILPEVGAGLLAVFLAGLVAVTLGFIPRRQKS